MTSFNRKIFKDSVVVTLLGVVGQALGFVVTMLVAKKFGANWITDSYYLAFIIPGAFVATVGGMVKIVFVPVFVKERIENPQNASRIIGSTITAMLVTSGVGVMIVFILFCTNILSFGQTPEARELTRLLLIELLPLIPLTVISGMLNAVYNSYQRFGLPEVASSLRYVVVIAAIVLLSNSFGIHSLVAGHLAGQFVVLLLVGMVIRRRFAVDLRPRFSFDPVVKRMVCLSLWPLLTYLLLQVEPLAARLIASYLPAGSVSYFSYAGKLAVIPGLVIGAGFMTVLVSHWSKTVSEGREQELQDSLNKVISMTITVLTPIIVGLFLLRIPLIRLLLQRGEFSAEAVYMTSEVFSFLVIAVIPIYLYRILMRIFFVKQDFFTLFLFGLIGAVTFTPLSIFLAHGMHMGAKGIALASFISNLIVMVTSSIFVHRRYVKFSILTITRSIARVAIGCFVMAWCVGFVTVFLHDNIGSISGLLIVSGLVGAIVYGGVLKILRHPDVISIMKMIPDEYRKIQNLLGV